MGEGFLSVTKDSLIFKSREGRVVGVDLDRLRMLDLPDKKKQLHVMYSASGEIKNMKLEIRPDGKLSPLHEAPLFASYIRDIVPELPVSDEIIWSSEDFLKWEQRVRTLMAGWVDSRSTLEIDSRLYQELGKPVEEQLVPTFSELVMSTILFYVANAASVHDIAAAHSSESSRRKYPNHDTVQGLKDAVKNGTFKLDDWVLRRIEAMNQDELYISVWGLVPSPVE